MNALLETRAELGGRRGSPTGVAHLGRTQVVPGSQAVLSAVVCTTWPELRIYWVALLFTFRLENALLHDTNT